MDVSIIIVNYNTFDLTCNCIQSIYDNTYEVTFEIILVDNASTECSPMLYKEKFPNISLIISDYNLGFAKGNNLGIQVARGNYILLLNSDTELVNNAVLMSWEKLSLDSTIGAISGKLIYPNGEVQPVAGRFPSIRTELYELFRLNKFITKKQRAELFLGTEFDYNSEKEVDWIWGAFFMFPKYILDQFEGKKLPDDLFMYGEDVQWCYRIKRLGYRIVYFSEAVIIHFLGGSEEEKSDPWVKYKEKMLPNIQWFIRTEIGRGYAFIYNLVKGLHYFSLFKRTGYSKGIEYIKYCFK